MTKFVAALFLPAVLFLTALLLPSLRRLLAQDWWRWGIAGVGVIVFALPWFLYQWSVLGSQLWRVMFGDHVYTRFTQFADPHHVQPWHFYITEAYRHLAFAGSAIWVGLGLVMLLVHCVRRRTPESVVILLWLVLPVTLDLPRQFEAVSLLLSIPAAVGTRGRRRAGLDHRGCGPVFAA